MRQRKRERRNVRLQPANRRQQMIADALDTNNAAHPRLLCIFVPIVCSGAHGTPSLSSTKRKQRNRQPERIRLAHVQICFFRSPVVRRRRRLCRLMLLLLVCFLSRSNNTKGCCLCICLLPRARDARKRGWKVGEERRKRSVRRREERKACKASWKK